MNKKWRKRLFFIVPVVVILGGFIYWFTWTGSTDDIEAVADQFKPDSSWTLVQSSTEPPATICASACPSLTRIWTLNKPATQNDLVDAIKRSGWSDVEIIQGCNPERAQKDDLVCSMHGFVDGYQIDIRPLRESSYDDLPTIGLYMK